jgi:sensor domain CHASE-containing protein
MDRGAQVLRELESVATIGRATEAIRNNYDAQWVEQRVGRWLEAFFDHDLVVVVNGSNEVQLARSRTSGDLGMTQLPPPLTAVLDLLRGQLEVLPARGLSVAAAQDPHQPARATALIAQVMNKPAIVAAVAVAPTANSPAAMPARRSSSPSNISTTICCARSARSCN